MPDAFASLQAFERCPPPCVFGALIVILTQIHINASSTINHRHFAETDALFVIKQGSSVSLMPKARHSHFSKTLIRLFLLIIAVVVANRFRSITNSRLRRRSPYRFGSRRNRAGALKSLLDTGCCVLSFMIIKQEAHAERVSQNPCRSYAQSIYSGLKVRTLQFPFLLS